MDDRLVALSLAFDLYLKAGRPAAWRKRLKKLATTDPTLDAQLAKSMKPPKKSASERKHQETMARWKRQDAARTKAESENAASWNVGLRNGLEKERAALLKYPGQVTNAVHYLYQHSRGDGLQSGRWTQYNWKELAADFGDEVAQFYRDATVGFWRQYTPRVLSEGAPGNTTSNATIIGLVGLEIEATETPGWPAGLKAEEVDLACRYASCELNGFPTWFPTLFAAFPERVSAFLMREIRYELTIDPAVDTNYVLSDLQWSGQWAWNTLGPHVLTLLLDDEPTSTLVLDRLLSLLQGSDISDADLESLASKKCAALTQTDHLARWYAVLTGVSPSKAIEALKASLETLADVDRVAVTMAYITKIWGGRFEEKTNVRGAFKTPTHLKDLYLLVNTYVRVAEDLNRVNSGAYSPELRDHAQGARDKLFEMLRDIPGKEAFLAIMEIAKSHPDQASRPWMLHHATSKAELDGDSAAWSSQQVLDFGRMMERTPANHRELAELAELRFLDFRDDVEHGDESIAKLLQLVPLETDMRNYIGRELRTNARGRFSIPQEEELADAKRPDLRFHGISFDAPVPVELKLADNWTGPQLFERLENQLCGDYLRDNRSGIGLFVLINRGKAGWDVPGSDSRVDFAGLLDSLAEYWRSISGRYVNVDGVIVIGIDLRKRFG